MTFIFSNENRLLFNRESGDRLLELSYGDRFVVLLDYEKLYKQGSTSYKTYLEKRIATNFHQPLGNYKSERTELRSSLVRAHTNRSGTERSLIREKEGTNLRFDAPDAPVMPLPPTGASTCPRNAPYMPPTCPRRGQWAYKSKICKGNGQWALPLMPPTGARGIASKICKGKGLCLYEASKQSFVRQVGLQVGRWAPAQQVDIPYGGAGHVRTNPRFVRGVETWSTEIRLKVCKNTTSKIFSPARFVTRTLLNPPFEKTSKQSTYKSKICTHKGRTQAFVRASTVQPNDVFLLPRNREQDQPLLSPPRKTEPSKDVLIVSQQKKGWNAFQNNLFSFVNNKEGASLPLQGFCEIEILCLYGLLQDQPVLIQTLLKKVFMNQINKPMHARFCFAFSSRSPFGMTEQGSALYLSNAEQKTARHAKLSTVANSRSEGKSTRGTAVDSSIFKRYSNDALHVLCHVFELVNKNDKLYLFISSPRKKPTNPFYLGVKDVHTRSGWVAKSCLARHVPEQPSLASLPQPSSACVRKPLHPFLNHFYTNIENQVSKNKKVINTVFVTDAYVFLKEKLFAIKRFVPKIKIWGFAFGGSFLLISMTSILQRQEQSNWHLAFSRNQMPGLLLTPQESSWECFENITLKYLNRKGVKQRQFNQKGLMKQINCYKDIWYLVFSESWNQQLLHNYTALFSNDSPKVALCQPPVHKKRVLLPSIPCTENAHPAGERKHRGISLNDLDVSNTSSLKDGWLVQPWYQLHARVPPKKRNELYGYPKKKQCSMTTLVYKFHSLYKRLMPCRECTHLMPHASLSAPPYRGISSACFDVSSVKAEPKLAPIWDQHKRNVFQRNSYKRWVSAQNDSVPSKMSCSTRSKGSHWVYLPNDKLKDLFYRSGHFSIDPQIFQGSSTDSDSYLSVVPEKETALYKTEIGLAQNEASSPLQPKSSATCVPNEASKNKAYTAPLSAKSSASIYKNNPSQSSKIKRANSFDKKSVSSSSKKESIDFETVLSTNSFSFLQEQGFFKPAIHSSAQNGETSFAYPLYQDRTDRSVAHVDNSKRTKQSGTSLACKSPTRDGRVSFDYGQKGYRSYRSYRHTLEAKGSQKGETRKQNASPWWLNMSYKNCLCIGTRNPNKKVEKVPFTKDRTSPNKCVRTVLSKSTEKISSYFLSKRNSISNRLMSGYQAPETKDLQLKKDIHKEESGLPLLSIKVPPALPFYESKIKGWGLPLYTGKRSSSPPAFAKAGLTDENKTFYPTVSPFEMRKTRVVKPQNPILVDDGERRDGFTRLFTPLLSSPTPALKRLPYRELSLKEFQEVEPLFEQVNKSFRISPSHFTFQRSLFTDYNDYSFWAKDTPAAIAISPSLEEEKGIKDAWLAEQTVSKEVGMQGDQNRPLWAASDPTSENREVEEFTLGDDTIDKREWERKSRLSKNKTKSLGETISREEVQEQSEDSSSFLTQQKKTKELQSEALHEDEEKKKEITKFEWLQQVRESEQPVEKRKEFQKLAYPNKEALFSKRLQKQPGVIQNLLVADRKDSFFGVANLFPKRLVAKDQKQINSQILRDEYDRRSISLAERLTLKQDNSHLISFPLPTDLQGSIPTHKSLICTQIRANRSLPGANETGGSSATKISLGNEDTVFIEDFLKSGALYNFKNDKMSRCEPSEARISKADATHPFVSTKTATNTPVRKTSGESQKKGMLFSVRTSPRNKESLPSLKNKTDGKHNFGLTAAFRARQHPVYTPHRRLRLRAPQLSLSSQNNNPQSRIDDLNASQSHRWWQKRRVSSSLLGAPSRRYLVMPEITEQDWRKIIEWQLKTYFLEEEKRLEPLILEKNEIQRADFYKALPASVPVHGSYASTGPAENIATTFKKERKAVSENRLLGKEDLRTGVRPSLHPEQLNQTKHLFKIKKIAVYLPWATLKKSLKKPFEWPLTNLSYASFLPENTLPSLNGTVLPKKNVFLTNGICTPYNSEICTRSVLRSCVQSFTKNKQSAPCFVSSISPHFKTSFLPLSVLTNQLGTGRGIPDSLTDVSSNGLHGSTGYKPFLFEGRTKNSYLISHQLLLAVCLQQLFKSIYKAFGKLITHKIKNSSLAVVLLPFLFNVTSRKDSISEFSQIKKRLKDLAGNEDTVSSLSEIVWYLRNSCRGRLIPRGVVFVETLASESTEYLKAIGGEAQVPVIVQSLRALPFTQNHPQRRLEKILTFAQRRAPCILFLDDLDSIGKSRTLLLKNRNGERSFSKPEEAFSYKASLCSRMPLQETTHNASISSEGFFSLCMPTRFEKRKWKTAENDRAHVCFGNRLTGGYKSSQVRPCRSHLQHSRFGQALSCKQKPFLLGKANKGKQENGLQLSDTEKTVEQRRVDLMLRLLTVMDGISHLTGVLIVTTSKNPASLDPALLRPGRFEKVVNLTLPNKKKRIELLKMETAKIGHTNPMPWEYLGTQTQEMTGTEISSAVNHSAFRAILQSTIHTFPTLEYGIRTVNKDRLPTHVDISSSSGEKAVLCTRLQNHKQSTTAVQNASPLAPRCNVSFDEKDTRKNIKQRPSWFLKNSSVHNPYKTFSILSTEPCEQEIRDKKKEEMSSQASFYHAGKQIVCSSIYSVNKFSGFPSLPLQLRPKKRFYKTKNPFLRSAHSPQLTVPGHDTHSKAWTQGHRDTRQSIKREKGGFCKCMHLQKHYKDQPNYSRSDLFPHVVSLYAGQASESLYLDSISSCCARALTKLCFDAPDAPYMPPTGAMGKGRTNLRFDAPDAPYMPPTGAMGKGRTNLRFDAPTGQWQSKGIRGKARAYGGIRCSTKQRGLGVKRCKSKSFPCAPVLRNIKGLQLIDPMKKGFYIIKNRSLHTRKCLLSCKRNERTDSALLYNRANKNFWWPQNISKTLKIFQRQSGNWYRLYLPKIEQNKTNREWLLPDLFLNEHIPILRKNVTMPTFTLEFLNSLLGAEVKSGEVECEASFTRASSVCKDLPLHKVEAKRFLETDLSYYTMVLNCFYVAFQSCTENRELLDLLADHLIRFKILRLHEVVRIATLYS